MQDPWNPEYVPYAELIGILRSTLKRAEETAALHPADREAADLVTSLRHQLDDLESRGHHHPV